MATWTGLIVATVVNLLASPAVAGAETVGAAENDVVPDETAETSHVYLPAVFDIAAYYDTRDYAGVTLNTFLVLPAGFSFFSFLDVDNSFAYDAVAEGWTDEGRVNATQAYTELNLFWGDYLNFPLEAQGQWAIGTSPFVIDRARIGVRLHAPTQTWGKALADANLRLHLSYFPYVQQLNFESPGGYESQVSLFYRWVPFAAQTDSRVYVTGWADFDVKTKAKNNFYTEHQAGVRIIEGLHVVVEYRHFSFLPKKDGFGIGLQYQVNLGTRLPQW